MTLFPNNHNFVAHGTFIDGPVNIHNEIRQNKGEGFEALRKASIPQAIHDSSLRDPQRCFPGTREEHVRNIIDWCFGRGKSSQSRLLWLQGPAGVGKSALAQTCTENIGARLGASFFFSRPNGWISPTKFVPTIAYQIATKYLAYRDIVDAKIIQNPLILEKSINVQFITLIEEPLAKLRLQGQQFGENIVVIDGLDECDGQDAQCTIIDVIVASILQQSTPFRWAFFSRPEPHIMATFSSTRVGLISWQLTLPVSRDADRDIEAYLRDGFRMIRAKYHIPAAITWPSENSIRQLVDQSAGLFIYPVTLIRHIIQSPGTLGPEQQLQLVLEVGRTRSGSHSTNPLSSLDQFYLLIMRQIPKEILPNTLLLLGGFLRYGSKAESQRLPVLCPILNFSPMTVYAALSNLHSVLKIEENPNGLPGHLSFYHASFTDFLTDVTRSTSEFCINTPNICNRLYSMCVDTLCNLPSASTSEAECRTGVSALWLCSTIEIYSSAAQGLFKLVGSIDLGAITLRRIASINWALAFKYCSELAYNAGDIMSFIRKMPEDWRPEIIHLFDHSLCHATSRIQGRRYLECTDRKHYVLGNGSNKALLVQCSSGSKVYYLEPYLD